MTTATWVTGCCGIDWELQALTAATIMAVSATTGRIDWQTRRAGTEYQDGSFSGLVVGSRSPGEIGRVAR